MMNREKSPSPPPTSNNNTKSTAKRFGKSMTPPPSAAQPFTPPAVPSGPDVTPNSLVREPSFSYNPHTHSEMLDESPQPGRKFNQIVARAVADANEEQGMPPRSSKRSDGGGSGGSGSSSTHRHADPLRLSAGAMLSSVPHSASGDFFNAVKTPTSSAPTEHSAAAVSITNANYSARVSIGLERVLVVHFCHTTKNPHTSPADQLVNQARVAIPGILNYLYFRASKIAVVYFGKTRRHDGVKMGVEGGEEMKKKMLRFMTTEIWPPLRTDVPDDSQPVHGSSGSGGGGAAGVGSPAGEVVTGAARKSGKSSTKFRIRTGQSDMQALIYLKPGAEGTSYLKLVLTGSDQLHFDITDSKDEKHRWENRKLHIRMLDSLETQKAIFSYEEYERAFRMACTFCSNYGDKLDNVIENQTIITQMHPPEGGSKSFNTTPACMKPMSGALDDIPPMMMASGELSFLPPSTATEATQQHPPQQTQRPKSKKSEWFGPMRTSYDFFERLDKPESATLDYKSYFSNPVGEIVEKATKFMCGFLNAYGYGRLVIGVHEMPLKLVQQAEAEEAARSVSPGLGASAPLGSSLTVGGDSPPPPLTAGGKPKALIGRSKDDDNEQIVIGVSITPDELAHVQSELTAQLQECVPPVPPTAVRVDCVPVNIPVNNGPVYVLILFEKKDCKLNWKDLFRQKSNLAIRSLSRHHMSLCPIPFDERISKMVPEDAAHVQAFAIVNSPQEWVAAEGTPPMEAERATPSGMPPMAPTGSTTEASPSSDVTPAASGGGLPATLSLYSVASSDDTTATTAAGGLGGDGSGHLLASGSAMSLGTSPYETIPTVLEEGDDSTTTATTTARRGKNGGPHDGGRRGRRSRSSNAGSAKSTGYIREPVDPTKPSWWQELEQHLPHVRNSKHHVMGILEADYDLPQLYIIDISVNVNRMESHWKQHFERGKYFNGWPSIPIWDTTTHDVGRIERHYDLFGSKSKSHLVPGSKSWWMDATIVPIVLQFLFGIELDNKKSLCRTDDAVAYRSVCVSFNEQYMNQQGMDLVLMVQQNSKGVVPMKSSPEVIRDMQTALKFSGLSMMPLLLTWAYQHIGTLPSPFPFVAAPLAFQPLRPAPYLIPIYFRARANACQLSLHIAMDARDGILHKVILSKDGSSVIDLLPVRGVGFAPISSSEIGASRRKQQETIEAEERRASVRNRRRSRFPTSSSLGSMPVIAPAKEIKEETPSIQFRFLTPIDGIGDASWSLKNLLLWLQTVAHHPNIKAVGHCNRSFAFVCDLTTDVCPAHFKDDWQSSPTGTTSNSNQFVAFGQQPQPLSSSGFLETGFAHTPNLSPLTTPGAGNGVNAPTFNSGASPPSQLPHLRPTSSTPNTTGSASTLTGGTHSTHSGGSSQAAGRFHRFDCVLHRAEYEWAQWE